MNEHQPDGDRFENTIDKIDRLYSQKEWEAEKAARVPVEDYAHTVTGQRLADLIDEMDVNHEKLPDSAASEDVHRLTASNFGADDVIDIAPDTNILSQAQQPNVLLVDTHAPMPVSEDETLHDELFDERDGLARIMQDFEYRIRDYVETVAFQRTADTERKYQNKIRRIRKAAALEVRKRQDLSRQRYEQQYKKKELQLRAHYKKVMALANKISRQKAELQQAKKQFEDKLSAANAVYKQVEDMRKTLRQHIGDIPAGPEEDERRSA